MNNVKGLFMPDTDDVWKENVAESFEQNNIEYTYTWWHKMPNGGKTVIDLLRKTIMEQGYSYSYYVKQTKATHRIKIIDVCYNNEYIEKISSWKTKGSNDMPDTLEEEIDEKGHTPKVIFLISEFIKLQEPIPYDKFIFYKKGSYPSSGKIAGYSKLLVGDIVNNQASKILELISFKKQIILQGAPGTGKTYIAKDIAELLIFNEVSTDKKQQANRLESSNQFELVQFHPSYTYEDFVRGIEVKTEKGQPEYVTRNKTLGEFAKKALENKELYRSYQENRLKEEIEYKSKFSQFIDSVQEEIDGVGKYQLTTNVYLFEYDDTRFKYKGDNWEAHASGLNMKYTELQKVFEAGVTERSSIKKLANIESLTSSHATYYSKMAEKFASFDYNSSDESIDPIELQKYVLIIDEINRANLPAVLGELIYALEYRGEKVNSMYAIDKDSSLVLPPNLYIIGTMNTADRSVGQIDYAIRRRFAFVDMLPTSLLNKVEGFDEELFKAVSELFIKSYETYEQTGIIEPSDYLSDEFRPEDVWIGHSYFIMSDNRDLRLTYEIKPILKEYVKDGIFKDVQVVEKKIQELA